jgi:hypothetical protein
MSQPNGPAAYSLYDLLRTLVERTGWPNEADKHAALASVDSAESMQIFGNLASMMACEHPPEALTAGGRCDDCGRQILTNRSGPPRFVRPSTGGRS